MHGNFFFFLYVHKSFYTRYQFGGNNITVVFSGKCVKFNKRPSPLSASDSSLQKPFTNNLKNGSTATPAQRPLRERIIHLLVLKPYRKPELLLWMERERASPKDKAELGGILEEVCSDGVFMHQCTHKHI